MILTTLCSILPYAFITAYTPGPNNILALNTISNYGWRKGRNTILGIIVGFFNVILICAVACYQLSQCMSHFVGLMKYIGVAYILWLAIHIAFSKPQKDNDERTASFLQGFILQFINVKIILYGITIFSNYVLPVNNTICFTLIFSVIISIIGISGCIVWGVLGQMLQQLMSRHFRIINLLMALLLLECIIRFLMI